MAESMAAVLFIDTGEHLATDTVFMYVSRSASLIGSLSCVNFEVLTNQIPCNLHVGVYLAALSHIWYFCCLLLSGILNQSTK